ncbi:MAG: lysozyme [Actinomycetota bacterium]|nr:lysozyme [Actinomycetota bacterium]
MGPVAAGSYGPEGPDVASYQHKNGAAIDWARVAASGEQFAFIKATEGTTYTNPWFAGDWQDSAAAGLIHGAYHYARPYADLNTAHTQAQAFASTIGPQSVPGTLPPVLDLEEAGGLTTAQLQSWVTTFLTDLQSLTGRTTMIYTYPYFWQHSMGNSSAYTSYPLWIANYGVSAPTTLTWPQWTFWQYTSTGTVDGISTPGGTDVDQFNGSSQMLNDLALGPPAQPAPGPTPSGTPSPTSTTSPSPYVSPSPTAAPSPTPKPTPTPTPSPTSSSSGTWGPCTSSPDDNPPPQNVSSGPRSSRYVGVAPVRFVDTRAGKGAPSGPTHRPLTITIPSSVPADAPGVVLNVSVVQPSHGGFLRAAATGQQPTTTALNFADGESVTGLVVTPMDSQRRVTLTPYTTITDIVVDLVGYYTTATGTGGHWVAVAPSRFIDTRAGKGAASGAHTGDVTIQVPSSVPADATGVVLDLSVVGPGGDGYLRLAPTGSTATTTALNFIAGHSVTGLAVSRMQNQQITVSIFGAPANLVVDLIGYYDAASQAGSSYIAIAPQRFLDTRGGMGATGPGRGPVTISLPASVPAAATSVVIDVSVVTPDGSGYVRLSTPGDTPTTTSLNYLATQNTTGLAISGIRNRQITVTVYGAKTQLVADVVGYHAG